MRSVEHRCSKYLNNRAENSHQPTRQREHARKGFRSPGAAQTFLSVFSAISPHFRPRRHRLTATDYRTEMTRPFQDLEGDHWRTRGSLITAQTHGPARSQHAWPQPS
ncbi:hypothetical protein FDG2_0404 [Candidatus Protofrankia californiensis]|uniref:DDE domain-containing protein n=1 Tax=Candidatus Protofrankia californiensis TaxID=1839754 RepID=A0A1C3NTM1_9ACTN|nr:hypothetical protein FDG2_0404 [Candidatus Protofrankia californiensis]